MAIELSYFNIWAVLVGVVIQMVIGALWYSPVLFGKIWLRLVERKSEDISREEGNKAMALSVIPAAISVFSLAILLGWINATTVLDAIIAGSVISIGLIGMNAMNLVFFEDRSIKLTLLNSGYPFVTFNLISILITFWR